MAYLHSPRVFQRRMVPSRDPNKEQSEKQRHEIGYSKTKKTQLFATSRLEKSLTGNNLTVINREGNGKDILFVSNESAGGLSGGNVPQSEFTVPRGRKGEGTIGRDDDIGDEVGVSTKGTTGESVLVVLNVDGGRGGSVVKLPDNDGLITRRTQQQVGVFGGGGKAGDPVAVSLKGSSQSQSFTDSAHG